MKNKKKVLIAVAAMGLLAVGTAGVGTAAWFQATQAFTPNAVVGDTGTATGSSTSITASNLYGQVLVSNVDGGDVIMLTSSDGYTYAFDNNSKLRLGTGHETLANTYGSVTLSFGGWYTEAECEHAASAEDIAQITAQTFNLKVTGGARTRLSTAEPSAVGTSSGQFGAVFGNTLQNAVNFKMIVAAEGGVTFQFASEAAAATKDVYVAINGGTVLYTKAQLDTAVGKTVAEAALLEPAITLTSDAGSTLNQTLTIANQ